MSRANDNTLEPEHVEAPVRTLDDYKAEFIAWLDAPLDAQGFKPTIPEWLGDAVNALKRAAEWAPSALNFLSLSTFTYDDEPGAWSVLVHRVDASASSMDEIYRQAIAGASAKNREQQAQIAQLTAERETVARLHRQQVERLEDDAATVAAERDALRAERDALRAAVDLRLRPVVEALAAWLETEGTREPGADAPTLWFRLLDAVASASGTHTEQDVRRITAHIRALIADAPAEVPPDRPRPVLVWRGRRLALAPEYDAILGAALSDAALTVARDIALAAGFDVPELPDVG